MTDNHDKTAGELIQQLGIVAFNHGMFCERGDEERTETGIKRGGLEDHLGKRISTLEAALEEAQEQVAAALRVIGLQDSKAWRELARTLSRRRSMTETLDELTIHTYPWLTTDAQALLDHLTTLRSDLEEARRDIETLKRSRNIIWCSKGHEILLSPSPVPDYPVLLMVKCGECGEQVRTNEALKKNEDRLKADLEEARKERDNLEASRQTVDKIRSRQAKENGSLRTEAKRLREALQEIRECCTTTRKPSTIDTVAHIAGVALSPPTDQATTETP